MLSYYELRKGVKFIYEGQPYEVLEFRQMGKSQDVVVAQTKIRNLITGRVLPKNFHQSDTFEEAELEKFQAKFIYANPVRNGVSNGASRGPSTLQQVQGRPEEARRATSSGQAKYVFSRADDSSKRFELAEAQVGDAAKFLKSNQEVEAVMFEGNVITITPPIKVQLKVKEAPPGVQGDRSAGGTKTVTLETGVTINVPLFVETGDTIELNTEKGEYTRRLEKG